MSTTRQDSHSQTVEVDEASAVLRSGPRAQAHRVLALHVDRNNTLTDLVEVLEPLAEWSPWDGEPTALGPGDRIRVETPGGGGWCVPADPIPSPSSISIIKVTP